MRQKRSFDFRNQAVPIGAAATLLGIAALLQLVLVPGHKLSPSEGLCTERSRRVLIDGIVTEAYVMICNGRIDASPGQQSTAASTTLVSGATATTRAAMEETLPETLFGETRHGDAHAEPQRAKRRPMSNRSMTAPVRPGDAELWPRADTQRKFGP